MLKVRGGQEGVDGDDQGHAVCGRGQLCGHAAQHRQDAQAVRPAAGARRGDRSVMLVVI